MVSRPKKYICSFDGCEKAYNRPALLKQHERTHTNERPFKCMVEGCDKSFFRKSHLNVHQHSHQDDDEKPFKCLICGKGAISPQLLKRHELTHTRKYECNYENCSKAFYHHQSLKHHIDIDHKQVLTCDKCNRRFQRPVLLAEHKERHHGEAMELIQCDFPSCFEMVKTRTKLAEHKRKEHPELKCEVCGEICVGARALKTHTIGHGVEDTSLEKCDLCDGTFVTHADLLIHIAEVHKEDATKDTQNGQLSLSDLPNTSSLKVMMRDPDFHAEAYEEDMQTRARGRPKVAKPPPEVNFDSMGSIIDIVLGSITKSYSCPHEGCKRKFVRHHAYLKHLKRHEYLKNLGQIEKGEAVAELDYLTDYSDGDDLFQDASDGTTVFASSVNGEDELSNLDGASKIVLEGASKLADGSELTKKQMELDDLLMMELEKLDLIPEE